MVGVTRFELVTSSVSGKRSPPELNARMYADQATEGSIGDCVSHYKPQLMKISTQPFTVELAPAPTSDPMQRLTK